MRKTYLRHGPTQQITSKTRSLSYGIHGNLHKWLSSFLKDRQMNVVIEGEHSASVYVESGVLQGIMLGPLMCLCHINDLPDSVKSQVRLFANDCLIYRQIKTQKDHQILQNNLKELVIWAAKWSMRFNAKKVLYPQHMTEIISLLSA